MFRKILIANRGEIACRIIRTARRMGVATVAVYSDADAGALHVGMADEAVHIGPSQVGESYLRDDRIIAAAINTRAEAIHPGYGFLSENPDFVDQVTAAGLVFIGPSAASIRAMGLKDAAKRLMERAGVPVVPGYHGEAQELVLLATKAREIGYPVLIKARAGGGGKGMRKVELADDFAEALSSARREAKAAFGDDRVLVEKYVDRPRHIECQVFGDNFGNAVHLFERDCSAQRRHQKVIEEAPAPGMSEAMRAAVTQAAVTAAKAIRYSGAGTIEFIADASEGLRPDRFWFMEMNTRLQVEHPVTEMVTGLDLVEWQLRVAAGEKLPKTQDEITQSGHAFEARIYAEDAARGFLPATGKLHHLRFPATGPALRVETGVREGDTISPFYDPMIAKLVVHGPDRAAALDALSSALESTEIAGSVTNIAFLSALARDPDFAAGDVDTALIARKLDTLTTTPAPSPEIVSAAMIAAAGLDTLPQDDDPWSSLAGYTHFHPIERRVGIGFGDERIAADVSVADWRATIAAFPVEGNGEASAGAQPDVSSVMLRTVPPSTAETLRTARWPGHVTVFSDGASFDFVLPDPFAEAAKAEAAVGSMRAPMPGLVKIVRAAKGDAVTKGQPLLVLEAMKMEHTIAALHDGVVAEIVAEGAQIAEGTVLVTFEEAVAP
ncbi:acetyl/propionyl/methylcrotonyl-CoA carboxylase subunit alpha [Mesorhizobium sp. YM1C-6-2]|uniref:acetyl/propionyl/methylcrotonyl-CoA carboxylase subunit alpha n=1 Tax=Mesorhizobium sp. YM1C-6-2 TaxID=1827501 RepID=UPI000EF1879F|nr:acetyl/propionyl/methylcrotonyl-CoA carboxylase subunit alpha [Mesorhizobium sp. YM1C-6-2]RLP25337.1 acetyl/propionyl/methylcrotonyl-CoA carboxylase subunit alpha [Mesorhizobium sp. YM1C-6-2]